MKIKELDSMEKYFLISELYYKNIQIEKKIEKCNLTGKDTEDLKLKNKIIASILEKLNDN